MFNPFRRKPKSPVIKASWKKIYNVIGIFSTSGISTSGIADMIGGNKRTISNIVCELKKLKLIETIKGKHKIC